MLNAFAGVQSTATKQALLDATLEAFEADKQAANARRISVACQCPDEEDLRAEREYLQWKRVEDERRSRCRE